MGSSVRVCWIVSCEPATFTTEYADDTGELRGERLLRRKQDPLMWHRQEKHLGDSGFEPEWVLSDEDGVLRAFHRDELL